MLRCVALRWLTAVALCCAATVHAQSFGEAFRKFPATALRGTMVFRTTGTAAQATLNGRHVTLAPGARIFDADNRLLLLGDVDGVKAVVHYTQDLQQQPLTVWILTDAERKRRPWPTNPAEAQAWRFDPDTQTWSQP